MNHIVRQIFTAVWAGACYRVFVMALIWTLYSDCGHILISSIHAKNIRKAIYGQGIVPNTFGSRLSMIDSLRKFLVGLTSVKTNSKSDS